MPIADAAIKIRILRAKEAELEHYVREQESPDWLAADVALLAGILAEVLGAMDA